MKKILVTGGLGYIGSHTVVELVNSGYQPIVIDNLVNSNIEVLGRLKELTSQDIPFYQSDFQNQETLSTIFASHNISGVIHFAAYKFVGESVDEPLKYYANNVSGLIEFLQSIENEDKPINFIFSSSCTVYGNAKTQPISELAPVQAAVSPYGATKQMCEAILMDATKASSNIKSLALRYFNPVGAHPSAKIGELPFGVPANLIPFVTQTANGWRESITVFGNDYPTPDGSCIRDYIHVVDLAKAHIKALEYTDRQPVSSYDVCNIGTGTPTSVLEVLRHFESVTGVKPQYSIGPRRSGDITTAYADPSKANKLLGWKAEKSLDDALADAWRWQQTLQKPQ